MKRVLMIAPSCYPVTGAEAIVNIKLLQAFSASKQFSVDLISRKRKWERYPSDSLDSYDVELNSLSIIEVDNRINLKTVLQNTMVFLKFGIIQRGYHWAYPAWRKAKELIRSNHYDYVLTKDIPSLVIGYHLQKHYGIKWLATWNDPCPGVLYPKPYGKGLSAELSYMSRKIINRMRSADIHIFPNLRLCHYMNQYLCINEGRCRIIPHVIIPPVVNNMHQFSDTLRLIHTGNLGNPRNPDTFLRALKRFIESEPYVKISFTLMGHYDAKVKSTITELNLERYVSLIPPVAYKESLQQLSYYDIAVIIEADVEEGIFLPSKVSDFMQMSIPIFAISPQIGVLNDLYNENQIPYFACVKDVDSIFRELKIIYDDYSHGKISRSSNYVADMTIKSVVEKYLSC